MENEHYESVLQRKQFLEGALENKRTQQNTLSQTVSDLRSEEDILGKSEKVLKHLIDKLAKKSLSQTDKLVTYGLRAVFPDRNVRFESVLEERGKRIWINLKTIYNENEVSSESKSSLSVIESFVLRLVCIRKLKRAPVLFMDESFAALHTDYIDNLSHLIGQLATKLGMDILLITQNSGYGDSVQNAYKISCRQNKTKIEKVK